MDSAALLAVAVIVGVPAVFVAARICTDPLAGLCLWVLLLPVTKTIASLMGYPLGEGPIVLQKLTLADPVLLLTAFGAWVSAGRSASGLRDRQGRRCVARCARPAWRPHRDRLPERHGERQPRRSRLRGAVDLADGHAHVAAPLPRLDLRGAARRRIGVADVRAAS